MEGAGKNGQKPEPPSPPPGEGLQVGMATGRVRAGFFHIRTRPAGLSQKSEPGPFIKRVFFFTPNPPRRASTGPVPHAQPSPKSETQTSIYDFPAKNHEHKHKSKHNHKHKHRNPKHKLLDL